MNAHHSRPIITEKSLRMAAGGWFTFAIDKFARKEAVVAQIGKFYKVTPDNIRTVAMHGKIHKTGRKSTLRKLVDWKKAYIHLPKGQTIEAFEVTGQEPEKK